MDSQNSLKNLDKNTIIYGHNMKDKSMFGSLNNFLDQDFYENHKRFTLDTHLTEHTYTWDIFSVYETTNLNWMKTKFQSNDDFLSFLDSINKSSDIKTKTHIKEEDYILTLSTCTRSNSDERLIIHAKLIK